MKELNKLFNYEFYLLNGKTCTQCKSKKTIDEFRTRNRGRHLRSSCRQCDNMYSKNYADERPEWVKQNNRRTGLKRYFGMTIAQYEEMATKQDNLCAICGGKNFNNKRLFVDHCHKSKFVRGLLCQNCNAAIGHLKDDKNLAYKLIKYLEDFENRKPHELIYKGIK